MPRAYSAYPLHEALECHLSSHCQVDDRYNARAVQRMVGKLASHDWQLLYGGFCALLESKAAEITFGLRRRLQDRHRSARAAAQALRQQQQQCADAVVAAAGLAGSSSGLTLVNSVGGAGSSGHQGAAAGSGWHAGGSLRGGVLAEMERCMEGASARLAAEPEVLLAASGQGECNSSERL